MGKVVDYFEYFNANQNSATVLKTAEIVESLLPKIEGMIQNEIARMFSSADLYEALKDDARKRHLLDESIVTALSFILSQYLVKMADRPNAFKVTKETMAFFVNDLIQAMIKKEFVNDTK